MVVVDYDFQVSKCKFRTEGPKARRQVTGSLSESATTPDQAHGVPRHPVSSDSRSHSLLVPPSLRRCEGGGGGRSVLQGGPHALGLHGTEPGSDPWTIASETSRSEAGREVVRHGG